MSQNKYQQSVNGVKPIVTPTTEVVPATRRRTFTASHKLRILAEADQCHQPGQLGALLRREGLYSSHLQKWRQERAASQLAGLTPKKRGRKADTQAQELLALRQENERLKTRLHQAELIIDAQKKLAQVLETTVNPCPRETSK
jgi:transposase-like protein